MSRDHRKLRVFHDAHRLVLAIYHHTKHFPKDEWFGIRLQMRKAAVSVPTNIVEGNARRTTREYCNFLNIALGSACELAYLVELTIDLELIAAADGERLKEHSGSVVKQLQSLVNEMHARLRHEEHNHAPRAKKVSTADRRP